MSLDELSVAGLALVTRPVGVQKQQQVTLRAVLFFRSVASEALRMARHALHRCEVWVESIFIAHRALV